jgi:hypothetical protein
VVSRPASSPTPPPSPVIAAYTPSALGAVPALRNVTVISDSAAGAAFAAPVPCRVRGDQQP